jgi:hypothetical protein
MRLRSWRTEAKERGYTGKVNGVPECPQSSFSDGIPEPGVNFYAPFSDGHNGPPPFNRAPEHNEA